MGNKNDYNPIKKKPMKILTVNVGHDVVAFLDVLIKYGICTSRSELFRQCINAAIPMLLKNVEGINQLIGKEKDIIVAEYESQTQIEVCGKRITLPQAAFKEPMLPEIATQLRHIAKGRPRRVPILGNPFWDSEGNPINREDEA